MDINIINKSEKRTEEKAAQIPRQNSIKEIPTSRDKYLLSKKSPTDKPNVPLPAATSVKTSINSSQVSQNSS
jgi:hypothetical protein